MKPLPDRYKLNKWHYKVLKRSGDVVLASQSRNEDLPVGDKAAAYEVFVVQKKKARQITVNGVTHDIDAGESAPRDEQWGMSGWTLTTKQAADEKFANVVSDRASNSLRRVSHSKT